ncbi:hypothetical protein GGQ73_002090 [Rhizobium skierniewicense]|uniref:Uncharacterized protein n=1 Tax=Rhizobium skierniewicense TaxID=984260 RepID=A0A7W6G266_9HYPH|nr:hypothetical protein [Rhizobium skierniewicense]MBB3946144.1 hypothetical protein [Rhizobium skierniewicense]
MQVQVNQYPQLRTLCWNRADDVVLDSGEAFSLYERNWRFVDQDVLTTEEMALLQDLIKEHGPLLVAA